MDVSFYTLARGFKSPRYVIIASLLESRDKLRAKAKGLIDQVSQLNRENQQLLDRNRELNERLAQASQQSAALKQQRDEAVRSVNLPHDPPVGVHGYGANMISLVLKCCVPGFSPLAFLAFLFLDGTSVGRGRPGHLAKGHRQHLHWRC